MLSPWPSRKLNLARIDYLKLKSNCWKISSLRFGVSGTIISWLALGENFTRILGGWKLGFDC
jgi:hypothetical protein